jgi:hypothetical protein
MTRKTLLVLAYIVLILFIISLSSLSVFIRYLERGEMSSLGQRYASYEVAAWEEKYQGGLDLDVATATTYYENLLAKNDATQYRNTLGGVKEEILLKLIDLYKQQGSWQRVMDLYAGLIDLSPNNPANHFSYAEELLAAGDTKTASEQLDAVLGLDAGNIAATQEKIKLLNTLGKTAETEDLEKSSTETQYFAIEEGQVFWAKADAEFTEENSVKNPAILADDEWHDYTFDLGKSMAAQVSKLRLDPVANPNYKLEINHIDLFDNDKEVRQITNFSDWELIHLDLKQAGEMEATAADPFLFGTISQTDFNKVIVNMRVSRKEL